MRTAAPSSPSIGQRSWKRGLLRPRHQLIWARLLRLPSFSAQGLCVCKFERLPAPPTRLVQIATSSKTSIEIGLRPLALYS